MFRLVGLLGVVAVSACGDEAANGSAAVESSTATSAVTTTDLEVDGPPSTAQA
jgi:hypothetical protein